MTRDTSIGVNLGGTSSRVYITYPRGGGGGGGGVKTSCKLYYLSSDAS